MQTLQILSSEGQAVVSVQIADVDPTEATVAVLNALKGLAPKRRTRGKNKPKQVA